MNRFDITKRMVALLHHDEAVIGGIGYTNFDLWAAGRRAAELLHAGQHGPRGADRARRRHRAAAPQSHRAGRRRLDPDATRLAWRPSRRAGQKNLAIVIMDNGAYQITGGQKTLAAGRRNRRARPRLRPRQSAWAADEDDFERLVDAALAEDGPTFIAGRIDEKPGVGTTERDPVQIRERFMRGLGVRGGAVGPQNCFSRVRKGLLFGHDEAARASFQSRRGSSACDAGRPCRNHASVHRQRAAGCSIDSRGGRCVGPIRSRRRTGRFRDGRRGAGGLVQAQPVRLRFTREALADLDTVLDHIVKHSPLGARRVHRRIRQSSTCF